MVSRNMGEIAASVRRDVSRGLQDMRPAPPAGPSLDALKAARVSATAT
jgi:hypothetical protein